MCSIYGIMYYKNCNKIFIEEKMKKMSKETIHRGPDETEIKFFKNAAIGINRLSIIGKIGKNAMVQNSNDGIYSVSNCEITNFKDLCKDINTFVNFDFDCDCDCDSKVIIPLYKKYGDNFVKKLGGMFAIAMYNSNTNTICLWRDALGVKPLYYYFCKDCFIFASEIKAIYAVLENKPEINFNCIDNILRYGFNPGSDTIFCNIKKVMPGEKITVTNGKIKKEKYWKLKKNKKYNVNEVDKNNHKKELKNLLENIVAENCYSDVPGGIFFSGGLDSSIITAMSLKNSNSKYKVPISIRFIPNSVEDEKYVSFLEKTLNTKIEWVTITPEIARNTLEELVKYLDEPLENATHIGTYLMSKKAKELGLKTIITGDGSDEFFIGYERQECWFKYKNPKKIYPSLSCIIPKSECEKLYNKEFKKKIKSKKYIQENVDNIDDALLLERGERLPEYHNMRLDRMTMANSIEAKVPFEDVRIADYSLNISLEELMQETKKGMLKEIAKDWLPKEVIYRKKSIFPSLTNEWISGTEGINWVKKILLNDGSEIKTIFNMENLKKYIEEHANGKKEHGRQIWAIIVLELWLQNFKKYK